MGLNPFEPSDSNEPITELINDLNILIERLQFLIVKSLNKSDDSSSIMSYDDEKIASQLQVTQYSMLDLLSQLIVTKELFTGNELVILKGEIKKILFLLTKLPEKESLAEKLNQLSYKTSHLDITHNDSAKYGSSSENPFEVEREAAEHDRMPIIDSGVIRNHTSIPSNNLQQDKEIDSTRQVLLTSSTDVELGNSLVRKKPTIRETLLLNKKTVILVLALLSAVIIGVALGVPLSMK